MPRLKFKGRDGKWYRIPTLQDILYKQDKLISGETIKTLNNESILGKGNISIPKKTSELENDSGYVKTIYFKDVVILSGSFLSDTTFEDYPYKSDITLIGVTESDYANVIFSLSDVQSKNYAPVCITGENIVSIYAKEVPESDVLIPLIEVVKV